MAIVIGDRLCNMLLENVSEPERYVVQSNPDSIMLARVDENNQWSDDPVEGDTMFVTSEGVFVKDHIFALTSEGLNEAVMMLNGDAPRDDYPLNEADEPEDSDWEVYFRGLLMEIKEDLYGAPRISVNITGSCHNDHVYMYLGLEWSKLDKDLMVLIKGNYKLGHIIAEDSDGVEVVRVKCNSFERFDSSKRTFLSAVRKYLLGK